MKDRLRCVLHIGMPKTGTSSIQATLVDRELANFEYLRLAEGGNHSTAIYSAFADSPETHHAHIGARRSPAQVQLYAETHRRLLDEELTRSASLRKNALISGEDILFLTHGELARLADAIKKHYSHIDVIAYIRPPISFMESAFQQDVKMGHYRKDRGISAHIPEYRTRLEKFDRVFGSENVHMAKFSRADLTEGDVVIDFCHRLNIPVDAGKIKHVNESLTLDAIAVLFALQFHDSAFASLPARDKARLAGFLSARGSGRFAYSCALVEEIRSSIESDLRWIETRLGSSLDEPLNEAEEGIGSASDLLDLAVEVRHLLLEAIVQVLGEQTNSSARLAECLPLWQHGLDSLSSGFTDAPLDVKYAIDKLDTGVLRGWALNVANPTAKLGVELQQGDVILGRADADEFRPDLAAAEIGNGRCGFGLSLSAPVQLGGPKVTIRFIDHRVLGELALEADAKDLVGMNSRGMAG
jgi:hypothetical protein